MNSFGAIFALIASISISSKICFSFMLFYELCYEHWEDEIMEIDTMGFTQHVYPHPTNLEQHICRVMPKYNNINNNLADVQYIGQTYYM